MSLFAIASQNQAEAHSGPGNSFHGAAAASESASQSPGGHCVNVQASPFHQQSPAQAAQSAAGARGRAVSSDATFSPSRASMPPPARNRRTSASFSVCEDPVKKDMDEQQSQKYDNAMRAVLVMHIAKSDSEPIQIMPGLYIGSIGAALNCNGLVQRGITHVLCAAAGIKLYFPETFTYKCLTIGDTPDQDLYSHLPACCIFIGKALRQGGGVLVHCFAGKSRSAAVLTAFLMLTQKLSLPDALDIIRSKRPIVQPNPGFCAQLLKWGRYLKHREMHRLKNHRSTGMNGEASAAGSPLVRSQNVSPSSLGSDYDFDGDRSWGGRRSPSSAAGSTQSKASMQ